MHSRNEMRLAIPLGLVQLVQGVAQREGGNPSGRLQQVQFEGCKALLKLEIESFAPAHQGQIGLPERIAYACGRSTRRLSGGADRAGLPRSVKPGVTPQRSRELKRFVDRLSGTDEYDELNLGSRFASPAGCRCTSCAPWSPSAHAHLALDSSAEVYSNTEVSLNEGDFRAGGGIGIWLRRR